MLKLFLNPSVLLILLLGVAASGSLAYWRGSVNGKNSVLVKQLSDEAIRRETRSLVMLATADAISKMSVKHTTVNRYLEKEVRYEKQYTDCRHSPDAWSLLLQSYEAAGYRTDRASKSELSGSGSAER